MKRRNLLTYLIILIIAFLNHFCEREAGDNTVQMEHLHGKWELYNQSYEVYVDGVKVDEGSDTFEPDEWIMELDSSGFCFIIFEGEKKKIITNCLIRMTGKRRFIKSKNLLLRSFNWSPKKKMKKKGLNFCSGKPQYSERSQVSVTSSYPVLQHLQLLI